MKHIIIISILLISCISCGCIGSENEPDVQDEGSNIKISEYNETHFLYQDDETGWRFINKRNHVGEDRSDLITSAVITDDYIIYYNYENDTWARVEIVKFGL